MGENKSISNEIAGSAVKKGSGRRNRDVNEHVKYSLLLASYLSLFTLFLHLVKTITKKKTDRNSFRKRSIRMNDADVSKQIQQMVRFIRQEAEEKANEISVSAEEVSFSKILPHICICMSVSSSYFSLSLSLCVLGI